MNARRSMKSGWTAALLLAAACASVGPDYTQPATELPASWHSSTAAPGLAAGEDELVQWWRRLGDPLLDRLVERSTGGNLDLRAALARVRAARALRGAAEAEYAPTVTGRAGYERRGESENTPIGGFVPDNGVYSLGFDAAWEIDLWGRVRRSVEAADADLAATAEDAHDVAQSVAAEVARHYVELRAFEQRLAIAQRNLELQSETLALVRARFEAGLVGERDVAQARTNLEFTRSRLPTFQAGRSAAQHRLAVLLGLAPGELESELAAPAAVPAPQGVLAVGVPADLVRRRPDIRRAERELAAESARIGVVEAELYPRLAVLGTLGVAAEELADLDQDASGVFNFAPSLRWNLFDGGRVRRRADAQTERAEEARAEWEHTVLRALEEAENALTRLAREQERRASLEAAAGQARLAVTLAQAQYRSGLSDFQVVVDSDRAVAELEDQLAESDATVSTHYVALCKALGGGWETLAAVADAGAGGAQ